MTRTHPSNRRSRVMRLVVLLTALAALAVAFSPVVGAAPAKTKPQAPLIECQTVTWSTVRQNAWVGNSQDGYASFSENLQAEFDSVSHVFCNEMRSRLDVKYNTACHDFWTAVRDNGIQVGAKSISGCSSSFSFYSYAWYITDGDVTYAEGGDFITGGTTANWTAP